MRVIIEKHERRLTVFEGGREVFRCRVALGCEPEGPKQREGDGRTPEGVYTSSVWSRSGASMGAAWACPIRAYGMRRRRFCGGRSTGLRFSLWTRPIARAAGPHGDRRWAGRSIFMREEATATGPRGVSRWTLRTWIVFFPCGTGWRPWRSAPRQVAFQRGICYTTRGRARRGSDGQSSMSGGLEGRRPATSIVAESAQCVGLPVSVDSSGSLCAAAHRADASLRPFRREPGSTAPVLWIRKPCTRFFEGGCAA